ncbi:hypothetical protein ACNJX9_36085 [Bradyrhizobium sp. DASA03076]|uniref:hypothetical protein n=1 Tax=Bradyrhizobium sp. BLXBL-03 TaxID=3395916 RepID=UPI003F6F7F5C
MSRRDIADYLGLTLETACGVATGQGGHPSFYGQFLTRDRDPRSTVPCAFRPGGTINE